MALTSWAVVLATSLADWTNCLLATGLEVLEEASLQALHSADVCLATMVAADSTCDTRAPGQACSAPRRWPTGAPYLGLGAGRVHQVLTGHLDGLVGSGKLGRIHQTLLTRRAVGVRHPHQVGSLHTCTRPQ